LPPTPSSRQPVGGSHGCPHHWNRQGPINPHVGGGSLPLEGPAKPLVGGLEARAPGVGRALARHCGLEAVPQVRPPPSGIGPAGAEPGQPGPDPSSRGAGRQASRSRVRLGAWVARGRRPPGHRSGGQHRRTRVTSSRLALVRSIAGDMRVQRTDSHVGLYMSDAYLKATRRSAHGSGSTSQIEIMEASHSGNETDPL